MIQRIQTLFLLGAAVFMTLMLFLPLASFVTEGGMSYTAASTGLHREDGQMVYATWPVFILVIVTAFLLAGNIFLFRNRKLQIRICVYSIILEFGLIGLMYYFWVVILREVPMESYVIGIPVVFPAVAVILTYLAFRGIRKDEILIRSMDKLR